MPIRDTLVPALRAAFPARPFHEGSPPDAVATFAAAHPLVSEATVWDDGAEVMVAIGTITHRHFDGTEAGSGGDLAERVTTEVVDYLRELFADRVLL